MRQVKSDEILAIDTILKNKNLKKNFSRAKISKNLSSAKCYSRLFSKEGSFKKREKASRRFPWSCSNPFDPRFVGETVVSRAFDSFFQRSTKSF